MTSSIANIGNFLRVQRNFPTDPQALTVEINKMYVDVANQVNNRISGIFGTSSTITGESWFLNGQSNKQNTLRQVYKITGNGSYAHGLNFSSITYFSRTYGDYTDGTNWYGLIAASNTTIAAQVTFYLTPTNIVVHSGAGAPTITQGIVVLEWISQI